MTAPTAAFPSGNPLAQPTYIVDVNGNPISSTNLQGINISQINGTTAVAPTLGQAIAANSLSVIPSSDACASADGLPSTNIQGNALYVYSANGPVDSTGKSQGAIFDRIKSYQGSLLAGSSANITATLAGDTSLAFSVAPKTIMPGQKIQLSVGTGNAVETVIVASSYVVSSTATSIPLQYPVVNANSTTAQWDSFSALGATSGLILNTDIGVMALALEDGNGSGKMKFASYTEQSDNLSAVKTMAVTPHLVGSNTNNVDRQHGNMDNISLISASGATSTQTGADQTNYNGRGVIVCLDMTVIGTGNVTLEIDAKDPVSGKYVALLTGAAVSSNSTNLYTVYPGAPATANVSANSPLPRTWRVKVVANNANATTYTVGAMVIV